MADLAYYLLTKYCKKIGSHTGFPMARALIASVIFEKLRKCMVLGASPAALLRPQEASLSRASRNTPDIKAYQICIMKA